MSIVNIRNIELINNPAKFDEDYHFKIKFEAIAPLAEDLEWRLIYVGSANTEDFDQELDSCMVGPIPQGVNAFDFIAPAPKHSLLPSVDAEDILGVTVIIITASYRDKEFVRVGYYVNTYYEDEVLKENPPKQVLWDQLYRNVLIEKPKVTRFQNPWDSEVAGGADGYEDQPMSGDVYNSVLPPPVQAAPAAPRNDMDVDQPAIPA
ncbi:histone chaperone ASF1 [Cutaneotrichosporon oleaginosum]|uniref:Anti-silencing function protein 1 n=1 Tax=Cutaneotrichosporon oleaginosum TaxID=879819 RepID=A0A0J0XT10_9TREE|nr:histone chaperone ASF1 [Cutaneotrichosporon oleaginosum]KLT44212.1 histone chaperone ASF1 [Cutaneotrichosporon oleaginosum]